MRLRLIAIFFFIGQALTAFDKQSGADYAGLMKSKYNQVNTVMQYKAKELYINGVNMAADRMERKMQAVIPNAQEQLDILNKNALAVTLGEKSRTEALRETVKEMQKKGIPAFVDASGREWSPEAYVNMDIRNTVKNAATEVRFTKMDKLGQDIVPVSSHSNARKKCAPYQGKFYSRSGKSGTIRDVHGKEYKYEPLSSTSYGEPDGLFGINCGHHFRGVSDGLFVNREKTQEEYEAEYPQEYKDVAAQRQQERKVRYDETQAKMLEAVGDTEGAKQARQKACAEQKQLDTFCEKKGLKTDTSTGYGYAKKDVDKSVKSDIIEMKGKMSDVDVRKWYIEQNDKIPDLIDKTKSIEEQARQACELRNNNRFVARELMADQEMRKQLDVSDPIITFEELVKNKMTVKGLSRDEAIADILKTATKTRKSVNKKLGLE